MKQEIEWMRAFHLKRKLPMRGEPPKDDLLSAETISMRRTLRTMSDSLLSEGLGKADAVQTARAIAATVMAATGPLVALGLEPDFEDFTKACRALVTESRDVLDKGLTAHDWEQVKLGSTMLGLVAMAICAATSIPYHHVLNELILSQMENRPDSIEDMLVQAGVIEKGASNDE